MLWWYFVKKHYKILTLATIVLVAIIFYTCQRLEVSATDKNAIIQNIKLPNNVAVLVSYEAETLKFAQIQNTSESFKGSEGLNHMAQIPSVERIKYKTQVFKDGNFETIVEIIEPHQKIEGIQSLSPHNTDKELENATKFILTPHSMQAYYKDGVLKFTQPIQLTDYKTLLEKLQKPCYKNNPLPGLSSFGMFSVTGQIYLSSCYQDEVKANGGKVTLSQDKKYTILRQPLLLKDISQSLGLKKQGQMSALPLHKMNIKEQLLCQYFFRHQDLMHQLANDIEYRRQLPQTSSEYAYWVYGKKMPLPIIKTYFYVSDNNADPDRDKRRENLTRALQGNRADNLDEVIIVNNETQKMVGKALYEGEEKMVMSQRYKLKDNSDAIEVVNNEFYVIDPITNTDRTDVVQTSYDQVNIATNF